MSEFHGARSVDELAEELVVDALLEDEAAGRRAALTRGTERTPEHAVERELDVRVVHHDHRVLAAHLEGQALVHASAGFADDASGLRGSGEGHHRDVRVLDDGRTDVLPDAVQQLDDFRRQPCLEHDLHEHVPRVRDILARLEDARVSAHERRKHLPGRDGERKVERCDDARHTDRATKAHRPLVRQLARHGATGQLPAHRGRVVGRVYALLNVATRLGERLAHLARHEVGDLLLALDHQVADAAEDVAARWRRCRTPRREATLCGLDGSVHVLRIGQRELADEVAGVGGIAILEVFAGLGGGPLAGHEVLEGLGHWRNVIVSR